MQNEYDKDESMTVIGFILCAFSGAIVGFILGCIV